MWVVRAGNITDRKNQIWWDHVSARPQINNPCSFGILGGIQDNTSSSKRHNDTKKLFKNMITVLDNSPATEVFCMRSYGNVCLCLNCHVLISPCVRHSHIFRTATLSWQYPLQKSWLLVGCPIHTKKVTGIYQGGANDVCLEGGGSELSHSISKLNHVWTSKPTIKSTFSRLPHSVIAIFFPRISPLQQYHSLYH